MRLLLWLTLLVLFAQLAQAGIFRRYSRRPRLRPVSNARVGPPGRPTPRHRPWPSLFLRRQTAPWIFNRNARRFTLPTKRHDRHPQPHRQSSLIHHVLLPMIPHRMPSGRMNSWRPLDYGSPVDRDPTFDYAPPAIERVRFAPDGRSGDRRKTPMTASARTEHVGPAGMVGGVPLHLSHNHIHSSQMNMKPRPPAWKLGRRQQRPSLWKMLAAKQRPSIFRRPRPRYPSPPPRYPHRFPHEAEIYPHIPNIVYFQPTDVMAAAPTSHSPIMIIPPNYKQGSVINTPLYSQEVSSVNQFRPIDTKRPETKYNVVGYSGPASTTTTTTKRPPTILQPVKTTPVTLSTTHNSVVKPFVPTTPTAEISEVSREEEEDVDVDDLMENPPAPIPVVPNSFNILDTDYEANDLDNSVSVVASDLEKRPQPVFEPSTSTTVVPDLFAFLKDVGTTPRVSVATSKSMSMSVSKDEESPSTKRTIPSTVPTTHSTTTKRPTSETTTATTTTTTTQRPTLSSTIFPKHPTMPTYKRRPTPVYARKGLSGVTKSSLASLTSPSSVHSVSSGASSKESGGGGSGEVVVITASRSKVKEYKPQFIANHTQLIAFDKVAETESVASDKDDGASEMAGTLLSSNLPSPSTTTTTKSPLQEFDPMQLLHSWFTKP